MKSKHLRAFSSAFWPASLPAQGPDHENSLKEGILLKFPGVCQRAKQEALNQKLLKIPIKPRKEVRVPPRKRLYQTDWS